jgi:SRSO17 transposase
VWVVFRRSLGEPPELKAFLSNAPADTLRRELVRVSGMRWPIETCFEEAKGELGMDQYQTRSWRGWHHHMTLVILAHHFLVRLKLRLKKGRRRSRSRRPVSC